MAFKISSDYQEAVSDINVTPLVDVMLVLVIILLVTAPLLTQSVKVNLPKTAATTPDVKDQPLQLGIDEHGSVTLNKKPMANLTVLTDELKNELLKNADAAVHLYADHAVDYGKVAEVMAAVQQAGIVKMGFVTVEK